MLKLIKKWRIHYLMAALFIIFSTYLMTGYPAQSSVKVYLNSSDTVTVKNESYVSFQPVVPNGTGVIFYPGGKVDPLSYAPMLYRLAEKGYSCFLVKMPFNLAVFNQNAGEAVIKDHPEIQEWYLSGHSLGGVMASSYASKRADQISGLIFLASYPLNDQVISQSQTIRTLSFYAEKDGFVSLEESAKYKTWLPTDQTSITILGGNHSQFGFYGFQNGDQKAAISHDAQLREVVEGIDQWLMKEAD